MSVFAEIVSTQIVFKRRNWTQNSNIITDLWRLFAELIPAPNHKNISLNNQV